eukprot:3202935-Amphidinium_carterae.3
MGGDDIDVGADSDQAVQHSSIDMPAREPNAQRIRLDSGDESFGYFTAVEPLGVFWVEQSTETVDDIKLKRGGRGFIICPTQRCITCRKGAPKGVKVFECQAQGCSTFTCIRCVVPLRLTNCTRQGLLVDDISPIRTLRSIKVVVLCRCLITASDVILKLRGRFKTFFNPHPE